MGEPLFVPSIYHKAVVEVNEKGTKAAAATSGCRLMCSPYQTDFVADHPFMFVIREDVMGTVLFIGAALNPLLEG